MKLPISTVIPTLCLTGLSNKYPFVLLLSQLSHFDQYFRLNHPLKLCKCCKATVILNSHMIWKWWTHWKRNEERKTLRSSPSHRGILHAIKQMYATEWQSASSTAETAFTGDTDISVLKDYIHSPDSHSGNYSIFCSDSFK